MTSLTRFLRVLPDLASETPHTSREDELHQLIKSVSVSILEPEEHAFNSVFLQGGTEYYDRVTASLMEDKNTMDLFLELVKRIRQSYISFAEYSKLVNMIDPRREPIEYNDICCCCHEPLDSWRRVVRLRSASGDPQECCHAIHHECFKKLKPTESGTVLCPLCRTSLGDSPSFWYDTSTDVPRF